MNVDMSGQIFGHLTVIQKADKSTKDGHTQWICQCDCGKQTIVSSNHLTSGHTTSCGHIKFNPDNNIRPGYDAKRVDGVAVFLLGKNRKKRSDNASGVTGVKISKQKNGTVKYIAQINIAGKRHHLGMFSTLEEAAQAQRQAEIELIPKGDTK